MAMKNFKVSIAVLLISMRAMLAEAADLEVQAELTIDGPALFFSQHEVQKKELWAVHCRLPLRGCIAHRPGLVMRVDAKNQTWIIAEKPIGSKVSLQIKDRISDGTLLFFHPLNRDIIRTLDTAESFIVIEREGRDVLRIPTHGAAYVSAYLVWLQSEAARTIGDARLWPGAPKHGGESVISDAAAERLEVMRRRRSEALRQTVPQTKPQVEFALRAQGGSSFFYPNGRAGY